MRRSFSYMFLVSGIIFLIISFYLFYQRNYSNRLSFKTNPPIVGTNSNNQLSEIEIPSVEIKIPVVPSEIKDNKWETTTNGISYLITTPFPGDQGNSVMYGHNWNTLLGSLKKIQPSDKIIIHLKDGSSKLFEVENTAIVNPSQTSVIDNTSDSRLTIFTCIGFFDSKRFVVVAKPSI